MSKNNRNNRLIVYDGMKATTLLGDEGWIPLSGSNTDTETNEGFYSARVPAIFRAMLLRANAVASIPFDLVDMKGNVYDSTDEWENKVEFMENPETLFWFIEAAWTLWGKEYLQKSMNKNGVVKILRPLAPASVIYDLKKDICTRKVDNQDKPYPPAIDKDGKVTRGESIVCLWSPDPDVEKGPPNKYPAKAALQAMGVLYNMDVATSGFFKRGMLHVTAFSVPPGTQERDKLEFQDKVNNFLTGVRNAWKTIFLNQQDIKPIDLGGGLEALGNLPLTKEKREDIAIALGIPMSKLFPETSSSLGGGGVVNADDRRLILDTALPDWIAIARELNRQVFEPMGYRLQERSKKMAVLQVNETDRATALTSYVNAFNVNPEVANLMAAQFGITFSDEIQNEIDAIIARKNTASPVVPATTTPTTQPVDEKLNAELLKYQRKALKSVGKSVHFDSDIIPVDVLLCIETKLTSCKSVEGVKAVFANLPDTKPDPMLTLASAINRAVDAVITDPLVKG